MSAPIGNVYYQLAKGFVKPKSYQPEELLDKAIEYFEWNENNPLKEQKAFGNGSIVELDKMRAMSVSAFCNYACIDRSTFENYEKDEAYFRICKRIKEIIYQQKFEGAAADLLNPSIIAREIGLADKRELTGKDGKDLIPERLTPDQINSLIEKL